MIELQYREAFVNVKYKVWHFKMKPQRCGMRQRSEGAIALRWAQRWWKRHQHTLTRAPEVRLLSDSEHFMAYNCLEIGFRYFPEGRTLGMGEFHYTDATVIKYMAPA